MPLASYSNSSANEPGRFGKELNALAKESEESGNQEKNITKDSDSSAEESDNFTKDSNEFAKSYDPRGEDSSMSGPTPTTIKTLMDLQKRVTAGRFSLDLLDQSLDIGIKLTRADRGFVVVPGGKRLEIYNARGPDRTDLPPADKMMSRTLVELTMERKKTQRFVEPLTMPEFKHMASIGAMNLRSLVLIPLQVNDAALGALVFGETFREAPFAEDDVRLLELLEEPTANALETLIQDHAVEKHVTKRLRKSQRNPFPRLVGDSAAMKQIREEIAKVCNSDATVLISGETGTGKELVAKSIVEGGQRAKKPCVALNVAALPESLVEAELFGHTQGAFTGASKAKPGLIVAADGGTLFLDEIGEMPLALQAKLLRFLEAKEVLAIGAETPTKVDVRVVAASHRDLEAHVKAGKFRADLFYRLDVLKIHTPPLREHLEDLPQLTAHLLAAICDGKKTPRLSDELVAAFARHSWPGNVRELFGVLQRVVAASVDPVAPSDVRFKPSTEPPSSPRTKVDEIDREHALRVIKECGGNKKRAADKLGISRATLYNRYFRPVRPDDSPTV